MSSSTRDWTGPTWLGFGFRPFFLGAGLVQHGGHTVMEHKSVRRAMS